MRYLTYSVTGLLWIAGVAVAQPKPATYILDSVVLPASAIQVAKSAPVPVAATVRTHFVVLPALEVEKSLASGDAAGPAQQIGVARAVAATSSVAQTQSALRWTALPNGQQVAAINIQSTGAYGLRAGVLVDNLPDDAQLRIYSQEHAYAIIARSGAEINALLAKNREAGETGAAANTWWTPEVGAGDTTIEVLLPSGTPAEALRISIPRVSHIYQNLSLPIDSEIQGMNHTGTTKVGNAASCNLDISCSSNYQTERNAVAQMVYTIEGGQSYLCTGTLLNSSNGDFVPYFLTANHCISSQSSASSLQTRWFYRSDICNSGVPGANSARSSAGATLLFATATTDSSLLRLNEMPPAGVTMAGWHATEPLLTSTLVYGLHHPRGDLLKYSVGVVSDYTDCRSNGNGTFGCRFGEANGGFYSVEVREGTTEGGSSGSALFHEGRVVGTLYGGNHSCRVKEGNTTYGRFDKFFAEGASRWLASPPASMTP